MIVGSAQLNSVTALVKHSRAQSKERSFFSKKDIPNQGLIIIIVFIIFHIAFLLQLITVLVDGKH